MERDTLVEGDDVTEPARDGLLTGLTASSAGDDGADRDGALRDKATEVSFTVRMVSGMMGGVAESLVKTTAQVTSYEHTVDSVRSVSAQLAAQMVTLSEKSRQVERVLAFIEDLALQTRMLSLNAAIEAARAGERGQGFAVVASAVRDLSRQTNAATTDIRDALTEIQRAALTATGRTKELDSALEGIRSTTHEFVATLTEQSQVSSTASRYVDEAAISVEAIATQLAAPSSHPQSKEEGAPHVTDGLE